MVTDALISPFLYTVEYLIGLIPEYSPDFGAVDSIVVWVARVDSLIPIAGPLSVMLGVLALGVVFVIVRLALTVWNLIWP